MSEQPNRLQPESLSDLKKHDPVVRKFLIGFLAGLAASGVVFVLIRAFVAGHFRGEWIFGMYRPVIMLLPALGLCKVAIAVGLLFSPRWRSVGMGLLASVAVGLMIFLGMCAWDIVTQ
jgi:hypothetical protein